MDNIAAARSLDFAYNHPVLAHPGPHLARGEHQYERALGPGVIEVHTTRRRFPAKYLGRRMTVSRDGIDAPRRPSQGHWQRSGSTF